MMVLNIEIVRMAFAKESVPPPGLGAPHITAIFRALTAEASPAQ